MTLPNPCTRCGRSQARLRPDPTGGADVCPRCLARVLRRLRAPTGLAPQLEALELAMGPAQWLEDPRGCPRSGPFHLERAR